MAKKITVEEVKKLAMEYYEKGGDGYIECYTDKMLQECINCGLTSKAKWIKEFKSSADINSDQAGSWM